MPRHGSLLTVIRGVGTGGSRVRHPFVARKRLGHEAEAEEWSAPSSPQGSWNMAPRWSRSSAESGCREDGAQEEGRRGDARSPEGEDRPPSQASARSRASGGIEKEGGLMAMAEEVWKSGRNWQPASRKSFT